LDFGHTNRYLVLFYYILICNTLTKNYIKHFFMSYLPSLYLLQWCVCSGLSHFLYNIVSCKISFQSLIKYPVSDMFFINVFSVSVAYLLIPLTLSFMEQKF
jgi:hypothetical protein